MQKNSLLIVGQNKLEHSILAKIFRMVYHLLASLELETLVILLGILENIRQSWK